MYRGHLGRMTRVQGRRKQVVLKLILFTETVALSGCCTRPLATDKSLRFHPHIVTGTHDRTTKLQPPSQVMSGDQG